MVKEIIGLILAGVGIVTAGCKGVPIQPTAKEVQTEDSAREDSMIQNRMYIKVKDTVLTVRMEENSSALALLELLEEGDRVVEASDYGSFEKVGDLKVTLPTNDTNYTTKPGDVILYLGHEFTLYYDTNTWSFTKLGEVESITQAELKELLGEGDVRLILTLEP